MVPNMQPPSRRLILVLILLTGTAALSTATRAEPMVHDGDRIAFCGDSLTDRRNYTLQLEQYLLACQPTKVSTILFGTGGESARAFADRMKADVLPFKPTLATVLYGTDELGRDPMSDDKKKEYKTAIAAIVRTFKQVNCRVILISPPPVDDKIVRGVDPKQRNADLAWMRDTCRDIAQKEKVSFVDLFNAFNKILPGAKEKFGDDYRLIGGDGVRPDNAGALVITYSALKAMGFDGKIGEIHVDLGTEKATVTAGHEVQSFKSNALYLRSDIYPFLLQGDRKDSNATAGIVELMPFVQDFNRFILKVDNTQADKYRVVWGDEPKNFTAEQLKNGINLMAEFAPPTRTPFQPAWGNLEHAIRTEQDFEFEAFRVVLPTMRRMLPNEQKAIDETAAAIARREDALTHSARDAVIPVTHKLIIEPVAPDAP